MLNYDFMETSILKWLTFIKNNDKTLLGAKLFGVVEMSPQLWNIIFLYEFIWIIFYTMHIEMVYLIIFFKLHKHYN